MPVQNLATHFVQILASNDIVKIVNLAECFYRHVEYVILHLTMKF